MQNNNSSIKKNVVYRSLLTVSNYLMAFITFPYITRVLGVANVGLVNFVDNTINYFLLFASMGVNTLGIREIARTRNKEERNHVFSSILGMNFLFTIVILLLYFIIIMIIPDFREYSELLYIGSAKILFTTFLIEWFYTGIENFKYITLRSIFIKIIYILSVLLFIKHPSDYRLYFFLTISVTIVNALINIIYSRRFVRILLSDLFNLKYFRDNITLGIYGVMTSMYLTFNVIYLGIVSDNIQVGYYTTAFRLYSVILGFLTAFTNVMLPRMSSLIEGNDHERFHSLINKSFSAIMIFCIPLVMCSMVLTPDIITVIAGKGFEGAIIPMRIIMPAVLLVGIAQVIAIQILMPQHKDRVLLYISMIGALLSILLNVLLTAKLKSIGSSIVLLSCEFIVTLSYVFYVVKRSKIHLPWISIFESVLMSIPCVCICMLSANYFDNSFLALGIAAVGSSALWMLSIYVKRHCFRRKILIK